MNIFILYCEIFGTRSYGGDALPRLCPSQYELMPDISQYKFNNL